MTADNRLPDVAPPAHARRGGPGQDQAIDRANAVRLLTLRAAGLTYDQIAREVGYADGSGARNALLRALDRHEAENAAHLRTLENMRLDSDERVLRGIIGNSDLSAAERVRAIDARTRLSARRSRMNGLDAPVKVEVDAGTQAQLDDALAHLERVVLGEVVDVAEDPDSGGTDQAGTATDAG